jgi:hypothetical protein
MSKEQRNLPGGYLLDHLYIKPYSGLRPNEELKEVFLEFNIHESLFHPYGIYGDIIMNDAINFMKYVPIIGEEFLNIFFKSSNDDQFGKLRQLPISGIEKQAPISSNTQAYIINFISPLLFNNRINRVISSYKNIKANTIIDDIYENFLAGALSMFGQESKDIFIEKTENSIDCIIPNWYPLDAMCWIAERSINKKGNADYLIYETYNTGFNFRSIDSLLEQDSKGTLTYEPSGGSQNRINDSTRIIKDFPIRRYKIIKSNDSNMNRHEGMMKSKIVTHDMVNKTIGGLSQTNDDGEEIKYRWNYDEDFRKSNHLGKKDQTGATDVGFPLLGINPKIGDGDFISNTLNDTSSGYNYENNVSYHFKDDSLFPAQPQDNIFPETYYLNRRSILNQLNTWVLEVEMLGNTKLNVGDIVDFNLPSHEALHGKQVKQPELEMYSGRYIITSIRYVFKQAGLLLAMQLRKNALSTDYKKLDKLAVDGFESLDTPKKE